MNPAWIVRFEVTIAAVVTALVVFVFAARPAVMGGRQPWGELEFTAAGLLLAAGWAWILRILASGTDRG